MNKDQIDFLIASVILDSDGLDALNYNKFYEIFKQGTLDPEEQQYNQEGDEYIEDSQGGGVIIKQENPNAPQIANEDDQYQDDYEEEENKKASAK